MSSYMKNNYRRELLFSIADLMLAVDKDHTEHELSQTLFGVQRLTMKLNHKSSICGVPGLRALFSDEDD